MVEVTGPIIGTVLLAGINPAGDPKYINGTVLVAGLNASGQAEYLDPDNLGGGGADLSDSNPANVGYAPSAGVGTEASRSDHVHDTVLTNSQALLGADVAITANAFADGPSLSLAAGIWLITASLHVLNGAAGNQGLTAKIWDGTTTQTSACTSVLGSGAAQITLMCIVTLGATTTMKISATVTANSTIKAAGVNNGQGNTASFIQAVRIG